MNSTSRYKEVSKIFGISPEHFENDFLEKEIKTYKKGERFSICSDDHQFFYMVKSGISRSFMTDDKGKEFTRILYTKGDFIASIRSVVTGEKPKIQFDCLTDCEMYKGSFKAFQEQAKSNIELCNIYSRAIEKTFIKIEDRIYDLILNAEEKYKKLQSQIPNIDNLIPQYQIATYLNVTNVQLSRVRKKMLYK